MMTEKECYQLFKKYAENYKPFQFDTARNDFRAEYKGKNNLIISFYRYFKVFYEVSKIWGKNKSKVVDFGVFPGVVPKIFRDLFLNDNFDYIGVGLGFTDDFIKEMEKLKIKLHETELDPSYFMPKKVNQLDCSDADIVLFLDVIEHLANPTNALDVANHSLKKGGWLILTTDNITNANNAILMLLGKTPLPHPLLTNMYFIGDWRPHFREYSKEDLMWLLRNSGFEIEKHEYFDRKQGEYYLNNGRIERQRQSVDNSKIDRRLKIKIIRNIKKAVMALLKIAFSFSPHFRSHQIIVARKVFETGEMKKKRPEMQTSTEGWNAVRQKYLGY
ncbi:MAG: methyltransferase domain-containing protein [Candidatus Saganbacteria bacterium]|nr:methyltransferase domain-containing protein [Candidatus Saganbacteria bacterium]